MAICAAQPRVTILAQLLGRHAYLLDVILQAYDDRCQAVSFCRHSNKS